MLYPEKQRMPGQPKLNGQGIRSRIDYPSRSHSGQFLHCGEHLLRNGNGAMPAAERKNGLRSDHNRAGVISDPVGREQDAVDLKELGKGKEPGRIGDVAFCSGHILRHRQQVVFRGQFRAPVRNTFSETSDVRKPYR